ncbi:MAG: DUF3276 family protein [Paludibacteraceae bacterium]
MEGEKRKIELEKKDSEIIYSKAIKAGKRIYYLDVKKSRNNDLYLAITESKKRITGYDENAQVSYEKHKIFLYKEDFDKFAEGLEDVISFIKKEQGEAPPRSEYRSKSDEITADTENDSSVQEEEDEEAKEETTEDSDGKKSFFNKFRF